MFSFDRLKENTFLLVTGVAAIVAWIIAFGGLCGYRLFTNVSYWIIVYELFLVLGILYVFATSTFLHYRMALLTFLAISIALLHGEINSVIPGTNYRSGAAGAYAAGYIILIMLQFLWVFVFGSEPNSYIGQFGHGWTAMSNSIEAHVPKHQDNYNSAPSPMPMPMPMPMSNISSHNAGASGAGAGAGGPPPQQYEMRDKTILPPGGFASLSAPAHPAASASSPVSVATPQSPSAYAIQVEALHDYTASPDDPSELSFLKGEILHVVERKGNWWQARKADGSTGIIPSNYFAP